MGRNLGGVTEHQQPFLSRVPDCRSECMKCDGGYYATEHISHDATFHYVVLRVFLLLLGHSRYRAGSDSDLRRKAHGDESSEVRFHLRIKKTT
jgi:hypothetical protein